MKHCPKLAAAAASLALTVIASADSRPHVAVADFRMAEGTNTRDLWMSVAIQETIAWRLRRIGTLVTLPTARLMQAQRDIRSDESGSPSLADIVRMLGARHIVSAVCTAGVSTVSLDLSLSLAGTAVPRTTSLSADQIFDLLDQATRWILEQLGPPTLDEPTQRLIFAAPARSPTALEYYAKAIQAARSENMRDVAFYVREAADSDPTFREIANLRARLALTAGRAGRADAARAARYLDQLARRAGDPLDRINAELNQGVLAVVTRQVDLAMDRFESALALAHRQSDLYMQVAAVGHICDLLLAVNLPRSVTEPEHRESLKREQYRRAADWQSIHLSLVTELRDLLATGPSAGKLAMIHEQLENWDEALSMHKRAIEASRQTGLSTPQAGAWMLLGRLHIRREKWADALDAVSRCLSFARPGAEPAVRVTLGGIYEAMDLPTEALGQYQLAYEHIRDGDDLRDQFTCLSKMAPLHKRAGRMTDALAALQEAIDIAHVLKLPKETELREMLKQWTAEEP